MPVTVEKQWPIVRKEISKHLNSLCGGWATANKQTLFFTIQKIINDSCLENAFVAYFNELNKLGWRNAGGFIEALRRFQEIPEIQSIMLPLRDKIASELSKVAAGAASLSPDGSPPCETPDKKEEEAPQVIDDILHTCIADWVILTYPELDQREILIDDRKQRRMDSLARLLSLPNHLSVCVAVTLDLYTPGCPPRLIIAANVGQEDTQEAICRSILEKLFIIHDHLTHVEHSRISAMNADEFKIFTDALVRALWRTQSPFPKPILEQAVSKICDAICVDERTFSKEEKSALLNLESATVLLASKAGSSSKLNIIINKKAEAYFLSNVPSKSAVKDIHAEQLITQYLFKINNIRLPETVRLPIGISKLCCKTCFSHLETYPVSFRGCHNQSYLGVVDLDKGTSSVTASFRRAATAAITSPGDTHQKRRWPEIFAPKDATVKHIRFDEEETKVEPDDTLPDAPKAPRLLRPPVEMEVEMDAENLGIKTAGLS